MQQLSQHAEGERYRQRRQKPVLRGSGSVGLEPKK
jgi:hypothetical protein